jgi:alcohol dehydrogenase class IV
VIALVDPELTLGLPVEITASTGMDALTQVIEPMISRKANPFTDAICLQAIPLAVQALPEVYKNRENIEAREKMSLVSLYGGIALANAGLGVVHGFAAAISGLYPEIGHGSICAAVLPAGLDANRKACKSQTNLEHVSRKIDTISILLSGGKSGNGRETLENINAQLHNKKLCQLGVKREDFQKILDRAIHSSSMKGNPVELDRELLEDILESSY